MRKYLGIFLFICLIAPTMGMYGWLQYQKYKTKQEMKSKMISSIDKSELVFLKFSKTEANEKLTWEHSKEFMYQGQMYDVVEMEINKDSISFWCWWDNEETTLNEQLRALIEKESGNNNHDKEKQEELIDFYKSLFYCDNNVGYSMDYILLNTKFIYNFNYSSYRYSPPVPPPKVG